MFDALFAEHDFASHNPVSRVMQSMVDTLDDSGLEAETASLDGFYASVRVRAAEVTSAEGKQKVIAELYERFFKIGFKKQSDASVSSTPRWRSSTSSFVQLMRHCGIRSDAVSPTKACMSWIRLRVPEHS